MTIMQAHSTHSNLNDKVLSMMGIDESGDSCFRCPCPVHGGDGNSFRYNNGYWQCWSNHCHEIAGGDIIGLWAAYNEKSREWATENLGNIVVTKVARPKKQPTKIKTYPESILSGITFTSAYFESRGFHPSTIAHFEGFDCFNPDSNFYKRATITVRDENSNIVGFTGRAMLPSKIKWYHGKGLPKSKILYNLNHIPIGTKTISIMEGPLDVWRFYEAGINNAVCTLGTSISHAQSELLAQRKVENVVFLLDPDFAGSKSTACESGMLRNLDKFNVFSLRHLLKKDIGETSIYDILNKIKPELEKII